MDRYWNFKIYNIVYKFGSSIIDDMTIKELEDNFYFIVYMIRSKILILFFENKVVVVTISFLYIQQDLSTFKFDA